MVAQFLCPFGCKFDGACPMLEENTWAFLMCPHQLTTCRLYTDPETMLRLNSYIVLIKPKINILIIILMKIHIPYHHSGNGNINHYSNPEANPSDFLNI